MHVCVIVDERHFLAVVGVYLLYGPGGMQRTAEFEGLSRIEKLDGEDPFRIVYHPYELCGCICSHAHMVLLPLGRRDGISRCRHAQPLVLADYGCGGVLRYHESAVQARVGDKERRELTLSGYEAVDPPFGNACQFGHCHCEKIHCKGNRFAVEVACRDYQVLVREYGRIVGRAVDFGFNYGFHIADCILYRPVHLRNAPE